MNVNDIKPAGSGSIQPGFGKENTAKQANNPGNVALREMAAEQVSLSQNSRLVSGARILQFSFQQTVSFSSFSFSSANAAQVANVGNGELQRPKEADKAEQKPIFDFEEVAKNVLEFVGGAMKLAKANGVGDDELGKMLQQARDGVLKGVDMAKEELAGMMNDDLEKGIENSVNAINKGLDEIENNFFGPSESEQLTGVAVGATQSLNYSREDVGELNFTTKDGDEVTISFEDIQRFSQQREAFLAAQTSVSGTDEESTEVAAYAGQSYEFFESNRFSFSVKGELDDEELKDIAQLIETTAGVVDEFFNGDVEEAFKQASAIGLEDSQIVDFSMELSRTETVEVVQTYQQVSNYSAAGADSEQKQSPLKTVGDYLDNYLSALDQNNRIFGQGRTFDDLMAGLVSEVEGIKVPELIEAMNRFQAFNQRLLDALPEGTAPAINTPKAEQTQAE